VTRGIAVIYGYKSIAIQKDLCRGMNNRRSTKEGEICKLIILFMVLYFGEFKAE